MTYNLYSKPYQQPIDLVNMLKSKGLVVHNDTAAADFLSNINFYRFKIYLRPYYDIASKTYPRGATFDNGVEIYRFDEEIRKILFSIISKIEIKLRTKLDQTITSYTNNSFWYLDDALFENNNTINGFRSQIAAEFQRSKDDFSTHFKANYYNDVNNNYKQLPPFWLIAELTTLGNITSIYQSINKKSFGIAPNNRLDLLAKEFGASNLKDLNNWILCIRDLRNRCAHHSRVWNSNYRNPSNINNLSLIPPSQPNRIYSLLILIQHICKNLNINTNIKHEIKYQLFTSPAVLPLINSAGFPTNWDTDPFWQ